MTINRLHKILGKLITEGHARKAVMIDKGTFRHPLESDGCMILPVEGVDLHRFNLIDDDGGTKVTTRGVECTQKALVLYGNDRERELES